MKIILAILDGWGAAPEGYGNAITSADIPTIKAMGSSYPSMLLQASGIAVGLPWGDEGNSEVGHLNIGAGSVVPQYLPRIISAIRDGSFFENKAFKAAASHVRKNNSRLHLMGLVSSGSVHSYIDHLYGLLEFAKKENIKQVYLHIFTDGKDSPPQEAAKFIKQLIERLTAQGLGKIATIVGRTYAMDRNENWEYTQKAYELLTGKKGEGVDDPVAHIENSYKSGVSDDAIEPIIVTPEFIKDGDAVIFFNFREDRARQLTRAFMEGGAGEFPKEKIKNLFFVAMTRYEENIPLTNVAFPALDITNPLAQVLSTHGKRQLHIAESEKYAHITYFFNGLVEKPFVGEERILVPSLGSPHYEQNPEMQAGKITDKALEKLSAYDFTLINFANADMLAHTGNIRAAIQGIETIDRCIARLLKAQNSDTVILITSDHGNAEEMLNTKTGAPKTEHSGNPVPFYIVDKQKRGRYTSPSLSKNPKGILADIAPTILELMGLPQPSEMTGQSLLPKLS